MSIIPSDVYGSLISGGVMTILAIANEHEKRREAVESAMADIPKKLDRVQRLSDVHVWSKRLHEKADGVLAAIFGVLQRIIDDMTMDRTAKFKSKLKFGSEDQVTGALSSLDDSISDFQMELDICAQFRMGRMHETINANGGKLSIIEKVVKGLSQDLNEGNVKAVTKETIEEHVCNALHRFYASNPRFNPVNGGLKEPLPKRRQGDLEVRIPEQNNRIVEEWYESLQDFDPSPEKHVTECMRAGLGRLTLEDREKSQWIMSTPEVSNWLRLDESNILCVRAENAPDGLYHPLSFTAALLTETLQRSTEFPVLSFFCGIRTNEKFDRVLCGPLAVLNSLNGQLLKHFSQKRPGVDLSLLQQENKRLMKKSTQKPKYAVKLFRGLLELLEDDDVVFIILDSWSRLLGDRMEADKVIEKLSQNTKDASHLTIKILVLDPLPSDSIHESAHSVLYVPDEIDGWKNDVSLSLLKASNERMVEDLKDVRNRKRELNESDSETSDQDW
ncbi:hypothetical protein CGCS363_v004344 [Colletotrichum siamense]|uniref:uncharacterized protein n=1 Tax=Colletotrichum siamense TaxID=690259 RepID=UPI001872C485|nr:uncharacterized protein CGCS363_v004344 [Colletotrichum siamense]KAF5505064.1 hypothetical protein CGCS363_v004344 [Colletotrichum siamense]